MITHLQMFMFGLWKTFSELIGTERCVLESIFGCFMGLDIAEVLYRVVGLHVHNFLRSVTFNVTFGSTFGSILTPRICIIASKGVSAADFHLFLPKARSAGQFRAALGQIW